MFYFTRRLRSVLTAGVLTLPGLALGYGVVDNGIKNGVSLDKIHKTINRGFLSFVLLFGLFVLDCVSDSLLFGNLYLNCTRLNAYYNSITYLVDLFIGFMAIGSLNLSLGGHARLTESGFAHGQQQEQDLVLHG